jgi:hypothetical protein
MAYTYSKIATYTVGSGGLASVSFTNIPQTYTDLVVKMSARGNGVWSNEIRMTFNGTTSGYSNKTLYGQGTATGSFSTGTAYAYSGETPAANVTASTFSNAEIYIPNYTSSNYKSVSVDNVSENNATTNNLLHFIADLWSNTAPITSITIAMDGAFVYSQYSTFHLYGIKAEV